MLGIILCCLFLLNKQFRNVLYEHKVMKIKEVIRKCLFYFESGMIVQGSCPEGLYGLDSHNIFYCCKDLGEGDVLVFNLPIRLLLFDVK